MRLLIIRHAIAVPRGTAGMADDDRPLTPEGEKKFKQAARGLARIAKPPDAVLTSPLARAYRTAEIAAQVWEGVALTPVPALATGTFEDLAATLDQYPSKATVAVVGHEPHLSALLAQLLGTSAQERLSFKKGGAALVELPGRAASGGRLLWFLPPKALREMGG